MDNQRLLIWSFFGVMVFLTWQAWLEDTAPPPQTTVPAAEQSAPGAAAPALPELTAGEPAALPEPDIDTRPDAVPATATVSASGSQISVRTDVLDVSINTRGATLDRAVLTAYPVSKDDPDEKIVLLSTTADNLGLIETGVLVAGDSDAPGLEADYVTEQSSYDLGSADSLTVVFNWQSESGLRAEKRFTFTRGSYRVDIEQRLTNGSGDTVQVGPFARIQRRSREPERSMFDVDSYSFDGPIVYTGEKSEKLDRDDLQESPFAFVSSAGWVATIQHHFLVGIVPPNGESYKYNVAVAGDVAGASAVLDQSVRVSPGDTVSFPVTAFIGPKLQAQLEEVSETLKLTVDYGWLTLLSDPLFWLLSFVHQFVNNWGLAIILVTVLIKAVFYKLTEASGRSMAKMREIQPRMKALQERYKDDRQALSQAMMELYKREKVNPAAGCLPILIQMPFFLAFYWVLLESVEMRQAPFALWLTDLSSRDPFFILPLIMGAAMFFQQKLNPAPADPVQAKVMQVMPVIFTGFFAFFPAGLVLYWVTNTLLSIAQQWYINRLVEEEGRKRKQGNRSKPKAAKGKESGDG